MWLLLNVVEELGKVKKVLAAVEMAFGVYNAPSLLAMALVGMFKGNLATVCNTPQYLLDSYSFSYSSLHSRPLLQPHS